MMANKGLVAQSVADWFLVHVDRDSGDSITHLKLQKLVYYAQAWYLANFNKPLFQEDLEAWAHGPVAPSLWQKYKDRRWDALPPPEEAPAFSDDLNAYLQAVMDNYGKFGAKFLEDMTHKEDPWKKTRGDLAPHARCSKPIPKALMRDFYGKKIKKTWSGPISAN